MSEPLTRLPLPQPTPPHYPCKGGCLNIAARQIHIMFVNVHCSNARMQALLQNEDSNDLLIQEPWF
jgi:hypothetical protein